MKKTERFTVQGIVQRQGSRVQRVSSVHIGLHVLRQGPRGDRSYTKCRCLGFGCWPDDVWPFIAGHEPGCELVVRGMWAGGQAWFQELVV